MPSVLNLGCGSSKIKGALNVDAEESCKPDLVFDMTTGPFPLADESYDVVYLFHTIEHIRKCFHRHIFSEIRRVLQPDGHFLISYPEFSKIAQNWLDNKQGKREFWEATIYGRQLYPSDHHVCAIDSRELIALLEEVGFTNFLEIPEPIDHFNTIIHCKKGEAFVSYEDVLRQEVWGK